MEQEQKGKERAEYGTQLIEMLSEELTKTYGKGFSVRNLWLFKQFYLTFNDLEILHTRVHNLTWSHYRTALNLENKVAPDKLEILKSPIMAEFLGFKHDTDFSETELEKGLISHLQDFLVEMGRGFAFVARQ